MSNQINVNSFGLSASSIESRPGYTVGGGVEYGFTPNWSAKLEYLWAHYQSENYVATIPTPGPPGAALDVQTVKVGVNYRFGWGGPVVARY